MARKHDDPNTPPTAYIVVLFSLLFVASVFALEGYFGRVANEEIAEKVIAASSEELARVRSRQMELINRYDWVDRDAGVVAIPVERAMELVAAELAATSGSVSSQ